MGIMLQAKGSISVDIKSKLNAQIQKKVTSSRSNDFKMTVAAREPDAKKIFDSIIDVLLNESQIDTKTKEELYASVEAASIMGGFMEQKKKDAPALPNPNPQLTGINSVAQYFTIEGKNITVNCEPRRGDDPAFVRLRREEIELVNTDFFTIDLPAIITDSQITKPTATTHSDGFTIEGVFKHSKKVTELATAYAFALDQNNPELLSEIGKRIDKLEEKSAALAMCTDIRRRFEAKTRVAPVQTELDPNSPNAQLVENIYKKFCTNNPQAIRDRSFIVLNAEGNASWKPGDSLPETVKIAVSNAFSSVNFFAERKASDGSYTTFGLGNPEVVDERTKQAVGGSTDSVTGTNLRVFKVPKQLLQCLVSDSDLTKSFEAKLRILDSCKPFLTPRDNPESFEEYVGKVPVKIAIKRDGKTADLVFFGSAQNDNVRKRLLGDVTAGTSQTQGNVCRVTASTEHTLAIDMELRGVVTQVKAIADKYAQDRNAEPAFDAFYINEGGIKTKAKGKWSSNYPIDSALYTLTKDIPDSFFLDSSIKNLIGAVEVKAIPKNTEIGNLVHVLSAYKIMLSNAEKPSQASPTQFVTVEQINEVMLPQIRKAIEDAGKTTENLPFIFVKPLLERSMVLGKFPQAANDRGK